MARRQVNVAIVGSGFIAETRARAYAGVTGYEVRLVAAVSRSKEHADAYARRHGIADTYVDYEQMLARPDIDVVDLCVPNYLHRPMTEAAAAGGKHVICSKPLTAFDGSSLAPGIEPASVGRAEMLQAAAAKAAAMLEATERAGVMLMYAENWVYAPSIAKANRLAAAAGGAILEMRGGECHSGSHSPYSKEWKTAGGGALLRLGVHPIGAMLHLKRQEGLRRWGRAIRPRTVMAEVGDLTKTPGCVAEGRQPQADGALGRDAIRVVYAAYVSAEEGRRVELTEK
jgi:predicted dehydrogenase